MNIPVLRGNIARRILISFRADPEVVQSQLPPPFRPKLQAGKAIVSICMIRLENIRPVCLSLPIGLSSENAAHRIAVLWEDKEGNPQEGVFIPRRDTGSPLNHFLGGRLFPGQHQLASFQVCSNETNVDFHMKSHDAKVEIRVLGTVSPEFPSDSCFDSLAEASAFFEAGCLGYSVRCDSDRLDGMTLETKSWHVETLSVSEAYSSYYADEHHYPKGSLSFDHALFMRDIEHEWHAAKELATV